MIFGVVPASWDSFSAAMKQIFDDGKVPGLVAFHKGKAVGWIQIDKRTVFPRLETSRVLKAVDDKGVWSVSCFYVHKEFRRKGLALILLNAACQWARNQGALIVEGYPIDTPKQKYPAVYA